MRRINIDGTTKNLQIKYHFNDRRADLDDPCGVDMAGPARIAEPDFAELHNSFEIQYEQFLTDTNDEIAKSAQKLLELNSLVHGDSPSAGIPRQRHFRVALPFSQGA